MYLSEPWSEEGWLPPAPVLSHLADPRTGRLPSLRFPPPRGQQQYQWHLRPPAGALPSPSNAAGPEDGQVWSEADRSAPKRSEDGRRPKHDGTSEGPLVTERSRYVEPRRKKPPGPRGELQRTGPARRPAQRLEQPVVPADRREFQGSGGNQVTSRHRSRPLATRRRFETSAGDQLTVGRPGQRIPATSLRPPPADQTEIQRPPAVRTEAQWPPSGEPGAQRSSTDRTETQWVPAGRPGNQRPMADRPGAQRSPAERTESQRPPAGRTEAERPPAIQSAAQRPPLWQPESVRQPERQRGVLERPVAADVNGPYEPTQFNSDRAETDRPDQGSGGQASEWQRRTTDPLRRGRPSRPVVPPRPSIEYARLALGAVAAEAAASLGATERPSKSTEGNQHPGYGRRTAERQPAPDGNGQHDGHHTTERERVWTEYETYPAPGPRSSVKHLSGPAEIDRVDSADDSEEFSEQFTVMEPETGSVAPPAGVSAELAALSALLSGPRNAGAGDLDREPSLRPQQHKEHTPAVTRAALTSEDVIRVPLNRPFGAGTGTVSSDTFSTASVGTADTAFINDATSKDSVSGFNKEFDNIDAVNQTEATTVIETYNDPKFPEYAQETEQADTESMAEDETEYDYEYEYYDYETDRDHEAGTPSESPVTSEAPESPSPLPPLVPRIQESITTERLRPTEHTASSRQPGDTRRRVTGASRETTTEALLTADSVRHDYATEPTSGYRATQRTRTTGARVEEPEVRSTTERQTTGTNINDLQGDYASNADMEDQDYIYADYDTYDDSEANSAQPATSETTTVGTNLGDVTDQRDGTPASYNDLINNVIGEVIKDMLGGAESTARPLVNTAATEVVQGTQYPEYDAELYDDEAQTQPTTESAKSASESLHDRSDLPLSNTEATARGTAEEPLDDKATAPSTTTVTPTDVTLELLSTQKVVTQVTTESANSVTLAPTRKVSSDELHPEYVETTEQQRSTQTAPTTTNTDSEVVPRRTPTVAYPELISPESHLTTAGSHEPVIALGAESETSTSDLLVALSTSRPTEPSAKSDVTHTVPSVISTPPPRTRLYLFSNFPEFVGDEQRGLEPTTELPDDQIRSVGSTSSPDDQHNQVEVTESTHAKPSTEQAERFSPVATASDPMDSESITAMKPAEVTMTIRSESVTADPSQTTRGIMSTRTTPEPISPREDETSSEHSTPYEHSTAVTESTDVARDTTIATRMPLFSLQSRPTFSKFYRFGKGEPVAVTQPTTSERPSTQAITEPTTTQVTTQYSSTQPTSQSVLSSSPLPPTTDSGATATSTAAVGLADAGPPTKPSLAEVRSAIQPFSLAEMLVESGQSLSGFLGSDYTMPDVLAIIERLRARREGRPVTTPDHPWVTAEVTESAAVTTPIGTGAGAAPATAAQPNSAASESGQTADGSDTLSGAEETSSKDDVLPNDKALPVVIQEKNHMDTSGRLGVAPAKRDRPSSAVPTVRRRKQWSLAEILDEKKISLPEFLAQGGDVKQLLLEYNGVELSAEGGNGLRPEPSSSRPPSSTAGKVYSLKEILILRKQTLKQFISGGGNVNAILEEYNGVGWHPPPRTTTAVPSSSSRLPAFLTRSTTAPGAAEGASKASPAEGASLEPLLSDADRQAVTDSGEQHGSPPGIRLLAPAPPIYGKPASMPVPVGVDLHAPTPGLGDSTRSKALPPPGPAPQPTLPPVLLPDELFERINQETEAVWAAAGGVRSGGGGGGGGENRHHQVDSTVFDIEVSPSAGVISPAVRHAVIASGAVGGCALLFFIALLLFCKWRQRREQQALRPGLAVGSERSSSPLDPGRINVNNYANAYRNKTTGFWGSLRNSFNQRYAAAYSDSPYGDVNT